jgi:hypothetical protein
MSASGRSTKREFIKTHQDYEFRKFRCTGSCGTAIEALAAADLWCGQPDCRGVMKPSYRVSSKRLGNEQFQATRSRDENPRFTPRFLGVLPSERPWNSAGDGSVHQGDLRGLFGGIAVAQELVLEAQIDGSDCEWNWALGIGGSR